LPSSLHYLIAPHTPTTYIDHSALGHADGLRPAHVQQVGHGREAAVNPNVVATVVILKKEKKAWHIGSIGPRCKHIYTPSTW